MKQYLTEREAAELTGLSVHSLRKRRIKRLPPVFVKIGKSVRYDSRDLEKWMNANKQK